MIHVIATITAKPGKRPQLIAAYEKLVPEVLAEQGCLAYGPAVDVDSGLSAQPAVRPDVVVIVEQWQTLDSLRAHLEAPHMIAFREANGPIIVSFEFSVLQPA